MNCVPPDKQKNKTITVNLTEDEYRFVQKELADIKLSRYVRRMLLERLGYPMPQPQN